MKPTKIMSPTMNGNTEAHKSFYRTTIPFVRSHVVWIKAGSPEEAKDLGDKLAYNPVFDRRLTCNREEQIEISVDQEPISEEVASKLGWIKNFDGITWSEVPYL